MMPLNNATPAFEKRYASHLKHLKLQGLQPKTVDPYARAIRTMGEHFDSNKGARRELNPLRAWDGAASTALEE